MNSEQVRGKGVPFCRLRRITGYLVGSMDRFNTAKREEVIDRVRHVVLQSGQDTKGEGTV